LAAGIIVLDQFTKLIARQYLPYGDVIRLFDGDLIWLVFVLNPGTAFGVRIIPPFFLAIFAFAAAVGLGIFLYRQPSIPRWRGIPFALIMGGAIGNLIDRLTMGKVVDFISVDMPDFIMTRWPVFNVADSAVSVGIVWLLIVSFISKDDVQAEAGESVDVSGSD